MWFAGGGGALRKLCRATALLENEMIGNSLFVRYMSRERAVNVRKINPKVPIQEAYVISNSLYDVFKKHGPLSVPNTWLRAQEAGVSGINSKTDVIIGRNQNEDVVAELELEDAMLEPDDAMLVPEGPMTRTRVKQLRNALSGLIYEVLDQENTYKSLSDINSQVQPVNSQVQPVNYQVQPLLNVIQVQESPKLLA